MTDKQIIIDEQMENLNNLATQQLKRIEEEKRQIEHIAKTHLVETFDMQREIDKLKKALTEIKEIAEIINDRTMVASYICDHLDKILQKISECEINYEN